MIGSVVVGTVGQNRWQMIRMMIRAHQMVATCFRCGVGRARVIRRRFGKKTFFAKRTIDFVRRNMMKKGPLSIFGIFPNRTSGIQQIHRANNVGIDKRHRVGN